MYQDPLQRPSFDDQDYEYSTIKNCLVPLVVILGTTAAGVLGTLHLILKCI